MQPNFIIVNDLSCKNHEEHAHKLQEQLKQQLTEYVTINRFHKAMLKTCKVGQVLYHPTKDFQKLTQNSQSSPQYNYDFVILRVIPPGAFELYFMGVKLYSKIIAKKMPNISQLVQKSSKAYQEFVSGRRILKHNFDEASSIIENWFEPPVRLPILKMNRKVQIIDQRIPVLISPRQRQQSQFIHILMQNHDTTDPIEKEQTKKTQQKKSPQKYLTQKLSKQDSLEFCMSTGEDTNNGTIIEEAIFDELIQENATQKKELKEREKEIKTLQERIRTQEESSWFKLPSIHNGSDQEQQSFCVEHTGDKQRYVTVEVDKIHETFRRKISFDSQLTKTEDNGNSQEVNRNSLMRQGRVDHGFMQKQKVPEQKVFRNIAQILLPSQYSFLRELFNKLDKNGSGSLKIQEIENSIFEVEEARALIGETVIDCLRYGDIDGDGEISFDEFLTCAIDFKIFLSEPYLKLAFDHFDLNNDGLIDYDEMVHLLSAEGQDAINEKIDPEEIKEAMKLFNIDKDCSFTFEDFKNFMLSMFTFIA